MVFASPRRWRFGGWPVALQLTVGPLALLLVLLLAVGLAFGVYARTRSTAAAVLETYALQDSTSELTRLVIDQETGVRGFALARDEAFLEPYLASRHQSRRLLADLEARVAGEPPQLGRLERVAATLDDWEVNVAAPIIAITRSGGDPGEIVRSGAGRRRIDAIRAELSAFQDSAAQSLAARQALDQRVRLGVVALFLIMVGASALACLLAFAVARGIVGPARAMAAAATRIAAGDLSVRVGAAVAASNGEDAPPADAAGVPPPGTRPVPFPSRSPQRPPPGRSGGGNELIATARAFDVMTDALTAARGEEDAAGQALREQVRVAERAGSETRAVLDATVEAIALVDPDRRVRLLNRAFAEGFGLVPEEILGQDFRALAPIVERIFADPQAFLRLVAGTAADSTRSFAADVRQRWPRERELALFTAPVIAPDGEPLGRLYALRDVTAEREASRLREERRQQLEEEVHRAAQLQADLLPREAPAVPDFELAARCLPAREVGGDFFDWYEPVPGAVTLTLGDVMGKGLSAALLMATVRAALEAVARRSSPARAVEAVAAATERDLERAGAFVTLFHARADAATRCVEYADAGHGHDFVRRASGAVETLPVRGLPLGVLPGQTYAGGAIELAPGDSLVIYSDGLVDARPDLDLTPASISRSLDGATSAAAIVERLVSLALGGPGGVLPDDLTVMVLRCRETAETG